ncbi:hypothetical protein OS965_35335 [Streptomyces sp. H27-G5]|uniref:EF-Tu C-terminal domain-related protein n=1 Tax=Streptomyces sp. H27-G5 TaxID=2996698 RepID=UPI00226FDA22|nr:EF-Tu/IF-2/RF-3 family GTPase [Streptomyces sp. H27-G5]MCY0923355.1 hypothetical protein [Streptomyces sp. H27-G5]
MAERPFLMCVDDVFQRHRGRTVVLAGRIEQGRVHTGDDVEIVGLGGSGTARVEDILVRRVPAVEASADMNVVVVLRGGAADGVERGQVLAAPGSISAHTRFTADIAVLSEEQGGAEVVSGERLCFHIRCAVVWGTVTLPQRLDMVRPLHGSKVTITLDEPVALDDGGRFAFRYRGRAAGSGTVTQLPGPVA